MRFRHCVPLRTRVQSGHKVENQRLTQLASGAQCVKLGAWSQALMGRIDVETGGLFCPHFADELAGRQALERLQAPTIIVGVDEHGEVSFELRV